MTSNADSPARPESVRAGAAIARLFPPGVAAAELREPADIAALYPAEARLCAGFALKRRADFAAGRLCARRALGEFGYTGFALRVNADRRPAWPSGLVGSISHTTGFCGAVVAPAERFASIGFDAEIAGGVSEELWPALFAPSETEYLDSLPAEERAKAATIFFSAKEAYYKCHFGITPAWLDFTDVVVTLEHRSLASGSFAVRPAAGPRARSAAPRMGRYALEGGLVLTGVAEPNARQRVLDVGRKTEDKSA